VFANGGGAALGVLAGDDALATGGGKMTAVAEGLVSGGNGAGLGPGSGVVFAAAVSAAGDAMGRARGAAGDTGLERATCILGRTDG